MSARTYALVSQHETGKISASIVLRYVRLPSRRQLLDQRVRGCLFLLLRLFNLRASMVRNIHRADPFSEN